MESILTSIKKLLGLGAEYTHFDPDIIMHINTVFFDLNRIGVGPEEGFMIEDDTTTWLDYIPDQAKFEAVKTYVYIKVKLVFDPPPSPAAPVQPFINFTQTTGSSLTCLPGPGLIPV